MIGGLKHLKLNTLPAAPSCVIFTRLAQIEIKQFESFFESFFD
jgi:hypothetical protein